MKKQHLVLAGSGLVVLLLLFFFGQTVPPKKSAATAAADSTSHQHITTNDILQALKQKLTPEQQAYVNRLENAVVRGDVKEQQLRVYQQLATFWKDSVPAFLPAAYYTGEAAKLENLEKNLTFAAHLYLDNIRVQSDPELKDWMAQQAKGLLEQALKLNPNSDSLKVSLGSCYIFGNVHGNPMEGITMIREVAERDPHNVYAQMMLGIGGVMTGQFDKAIERFKKVIEHQPNNLEARINLAEAYERKGDKQSAIEWYEKSKSLISNQEIIQEIDARITQLKK
ncbi:MAG TPA: tetratricopeptide repeat protein [Chitinophagaceae bacterium]|nr:tetratricopeptide repeat protein [Chitinophagaceae bacterium]